MEGSEGVEGTEKTPMFIVRMTKDGASFRNIVFEAEDIAQAVAYGINTSETGYTAEVRSLEWMLEEYDSPYLSVDIQVPITVDIPITEDAVERFMSLSPPEQDELALSTLYWDLKNKGQWPVVAMAGRPMCVHPNELPARYVGMWFIHGGKGPYWDEDRTKAFMAERGRR